MSLEGEITMAPTSEEDWEAESDARTLAEAEGIKAVPEKMKKAQAAAKRMLAEEKAKAEAMEKIAGAKFDYKDKPKEEKKKEEN